MDDFRLINNLELALKAFREEQSSSDGSLPTRVTGGPSRTKLLAAARGLVDALESPRSTIVEISKWPAAHAALRTAFMLRIFENWADGETKTAKEISVQNGAEELLVVRIMRSLVGIRFFVETAENTYGHSTLSRELIEPTFRTMVTGMASSAGLTMAKLPEYLASIGFRSPDSPDNALFQYALNTKLGMFQWLEKHPEQLAAFSAYFAASTKRRGPVLRAIISSLLSSNPLVKPGEETRKQDDQVLLVDVGAGHGQVLADIRKDQQHLVGRIIAQDLPEVIDTRESADGVKNMAHDFLQPQPVKGASIYFFSHIFHDWPDATCRQILTNTVSALTPHYSRVVIVDQVLPNIGAPAISSLLDLSMMNFGGMERTERQWRELLEEVGLSVVSIEPSKTGIAGSDGTIVAVLEQ